MAELFNFTGSQNQVRPQSPTVNAVPNTQAADTFKSLSNLFGAAIDANNTLKQKEKAAAVESRRLQSLADAEQGAIQKEKDNATFLKASSDFNVMEQEYNILLQGVGTNKEAALKLTTDYNAENNVAFKSLNPAVQLRMNSAYQSNSNKAVNNYLAIAKKSDLDSFKGSVSTALPTILNMSVSGQGQVYSDLQEVAVARGMTKSEFGTLFATNSSNFIISSLDKEALANNFDYGSLTNAYTALENLSSLDPKNSKVINDTRNKLDTIKNSVDSALSSNITTAISVGDQVSFNRNNQIGLDNGVFSKEGSNLNVARYIKQATSSGTLALSSAETLMINSGSKITVEAMEDGETKNAVKTQITNAIKGVFNNPGVDNVNVDLLQWHSKNNPAIYKPEWDVSLNTAANNLIAAASNTKLEDGDKSEAVQQATDALNRVKTLSFGVANKEDLLRISVTETLALSGQVKNIPEALRLINSVGGVKLLPSNSPLIIDLKRVVSPDSFGEASRTLSVLSTVMDGKEAFDIVEETYTYIKPEDSRGEYSQIAATLIKRAGISHENMSKVESTLLQEGMLSGEKAAELTQVLDGTNPRANSRNGHLHYTNDEGDSVTLPMKDAQWAIIAKTISDESSVDNKISGISIPMDKAASYISKLLHTEGKVIQAAFSPFLKAVILAVDDYGLGGSSGIDIVTGVTANLNKFTGDIVTDGFDSAYLDLKENNISVISEVARAYNLDKDALIQEYLEGVEKNAETLGNDPSVTAVRGAFTAMGKVMEDILSQAGDYLVSPVGAGTLSYYEDFSAIADYLKDRESGSKVFPEGVLHTGQESQTANTTAYGVVAVDYTDKNGVSKRASMPKKAGETDKQHAIRYYKKRVLPSLQRVDGLENESTDVVNALIAIAWNTGSIGSSFDLNDSKASAGSILDVTTAAGLQSAGVVNRSITDYNSIAVHKGWGEVGYVETVQTDSKGNKFSVDFYSSKGTLLYSDKQQKASHKGSGLLGGFKVTLNSGGDVDTNNQSADTALPKTIKAIKSLVPSYDSFSKELQTGLILSRKVLANSPKALGLINSSKYSEAMVEVVKFSAYNKSSKTNDQDSKAVNKLVRALNPLALLEKPTQDK